jgi:hypothetical protein
VFGCVVTTVIIAEGIVRLQDSNNVLGRRYSDYIHYVNYYQESIVFSLSCFSSWKSFLQPISLHPMFKLQGLKMWPNPSDECISIYKVPKLPIPCSSLANSWKNIPASLAEKFSAEKKLNFYFLKAFGLMKIFLSVSLCLGKFSIFFICKELERIRIRVKLIFKEFGPLFGLFLYKISKNMAAALSGLSTFPSALFGHNVL